MSQFLKLVIVAVLSVTASWALAQGHKPLNRVDAKQVAKHITYIEKSVDLGLPIYDIYYVVNSLGEFETERTGDVEVVKLAEEVKESDGSKTFVYEVYTPFSGDEGSTGQLFCVAYVTQAPAGELGYKPAICEIYFWDDEGLWDE